MKLGRIACQGIHGNVDISKLWLLVLPISVPERILFSHGGYILTEVETIDILAQDIPKGRIWDSTSAYGLTIEVTDTLPRSKGFEMGWFFSCNEPRC